jgi:hypothetical protein
MNHYTAYYSKVGEHGCEATARGDVIATAGNIELCAKACTAKKSWCTAFEWDGKKCTLLQAKGPQTTNGASSMYVLKAHGKCLDSSAGPNKGFKPYFYACQNGNPNQEWRYSGNLLAAKAGGYKFCLDTGNPPVPDNRIVQLWDCDSVKNAGGNGKWAYDASAKHLKANGKCLDSGNPPVNNEVKVKMYGCQSGNANQQWTMEKAATASSAQCWLSRSA